MKFARLSVLALTLACRLAPAEPHLAPLKASREDTSSLLHDYTSASCSRNFEQAIAPLALKQVRTPFEKKFAVVAPDIASASSNNLKRIRDSLAKSRGLSNYIVTAERMANEIGSEYIAQHSTSVATASKILSSGEILSPDELIRRCQLPVSVKNNLHSRVNRDGMIGEQDVVFVGLQKMKPGEKNRFGEVTFFFDKEKVLELGYFTPFSFDVGTEWALDNDGIMNGDKKRALATEKARISLYKNFVFKGPEAYKELLTLSIANRQWEKENSTSVRFRETIHAGFSEYDRILQGEVKDWHFPKGDLRKKFETLFSFFDQKLPPHITNAHVGLLAAYLSLPMPDSVKNLDSQGSSFVQDPALTSYAGFPGSPLDDPALLTRTAGFWELKVPRSISLKHVQAIQIPQTDENLQREVEAYARAKSRKVQKMLRETFVYYKFED